MRNSIVRPSRSSLVLCGWIVLVAVAPVTFRVVSSAEQPVAKSLTAELAEQVVERVVPEVERLRGLEFKQPVPVSVIDDEQAHRYILRRLETFDQLETIRVLQDVYALLGLLDEGTDLLELMLEVLEEQVAGFYDPSDGSFYLLDDQPADAVEVLTAHELTHALEDQHFDMDARLEQALENDDELFAISSIHEGSATLLMMIHMMQSPSRAGAGAAAALGGASAEQIERLEALPPILKRQLLGPYVLGMHFLIEGDYLSLGRGFPAERVDGIYRDTPDSSEQILHPEKYWQEENRDGPIPVSLAGAAEILGQGWERRGGGVVGELTLGVLVGAPTPSPQAIAGGAFDGAAWTNEAASGWGGDSWELWRQGDEQVLLWLTRWDTAGDATEFAAALPRRGRLRFKRKGSAVAVVAGIEGRRASRLLARLLEGAKVRPVVDEP